MNLIHEAEDRILKPIKGSGSLIARRAEGAALQSASLFGGQVTLDRRSWACSEVEFRWTAPQHVVILTEQGATGTTYIREGQRLVYDGCDRPGAVSFVPAGLERRGHFRDADLVYTALWIDPALDLPGCARLSGLRLQVNARDPVIQALLGSLGAEMAAGRAHEAVYLEHLVALVAMRLGGDGRVRPGTGGPPRHAGRLGWPLLARLNEYIDAHMDQGIGLGELAGLAGMPVDTFARRFKAETGMAPYAYVLQRRVRRAQALLCESGMPISAMALELGFSSQSHFTSTFRRLTGATPHAYRRDNAGVPDRDIAA